MNHKRIRCLYPAAEQPGAVIYWMSRDQRTEDNWAFLHAQALALKAKAPLVVVFGLASNFLGATRRQYGFMLRGLAELQADLKAKNIPLFLLSGDPGEEVARFAAQHKAGAVVCDFDPLRVKVAWKKNLLPRLSIPLYEVDAHNIVPCWIASPKQEFGAYTIRPKIHRLLSEFLEDFPKLKKHPFTFKAKAPAIKVEAFLKDLKVDQTVGEIGWIAPGEKAAQKALKGFIQRKLADYNEQRNDPSLDGQSGLSPYLHFGQLSAQRVALSVMASCAGQDAKDAFLEELIVRRELSDNFCYYCADYDSVDCAPRWAKITLSEHAGDKRAYVYSLKELESAKTHDELWNAAQTEMVTTGKMHGYLRMYWAKKILEWTASVQEAFRAAIYLNDRYELDGRDPNGYAGIAWSLAGVHDRAWGERAIFGKIRYMSYNGCKGKFDVKAYVQKVRDLKG